MVSFSAVTGIGNRLRAAREARGRTLDDLAAATRINKKFLEEIESGIQPAVPDIYYRAFVKTIAAELGEDAAGLAELTKEADPIVSPVSGGPEEPGAPDQTPRLSPAAPTIAAARQRTGPETIRRQAKILVGLATLVVVGLIMSVYWLRNERNEKGVQEISFAEMVKEQTAKSKVPDSATGTSAPSAPVGAQLVPAVRTPAKGDSLVLQAVTTESVWVHIELDGSAASEYTLPPNYQIAWRAAKQFSLSLGNPGGISFVLNGKKLGTLAEGKKPLKNFILSRTTLDTR